jgi:hypothetical protein
MYLVLIETSGNQNYIFSTNKLKENIGASELTHRAGTKWVLDAVGEVTGLKSLQIWKDSDRLRKLLLDPKTNPQIENPETKVEIIIAASGKALLLVKTQADAKKIVQTVTHKALREAPGLEIAGVFCEFDWEKHVLGETNKKVHKEHERVRSLKPSGAFRFLRLPVVDECVTSGLPASKALPNPDKELIPTSSVSEFKQKEHDEGIDRVKALLHSDSRYQNHYLAGDTNDLEDVKKFDKDAKEIDWLSVIHADGNGLGEIFLKFHQHLKFTTPDRNRDYVNALRKFSLALDICTEKSFLQALSALHTYPHQKDGQTLIPLTPLILGGDDLTVICDGKHAIPFTHKFLIEFEKETKKIDHPDVGGIIVEVAKEALGIGRLSACAGIAIIKPHFPFSVAYELAESLTRNAKEVKKVIQHPERIKEKIPYPCSALDFHILYDSSDVDLDQIRKKIELDKQTLLYRRPFVVTPMEDLQVATNHSWAEFYHWKHLIERVKILNAKEDGKYKLPNSQTHDLRSGLSLLGKQGADARYRLIRDRYRDKGLVTLAGSEDSLFQTYQFQTDQPNQLKGKQTTALMDAINAAAFLGDLIGEDNEQE